MTGALRATAGAALFAVLTVLHTWPLARDLSRSLVPNDDVLVNTWALTDLAAQLVRDPLHPLNGKIFYPYANSLAVVDHNGTGALLAMPLVQLGVPPLLVYNVALLSSFALSGLFMLLLVRRLTGSLGAGLVAGCVFAFSSYRFYNLVHLHLLGTQWLPLALLALHRFIERPGPGRLAIVAATGWLVALASWHMALIGGVGLAVAALALLPLDRRAWLERAVPLLAVAALVALSLLPFGLTYARLADRWSESGPETTGARISMSADLADLLPLPDPDAPRSARLASTSPWRKTSGLFPGLLAATLAAAALLATRPRQRQGSARWRISSLVGAALAAPAVLTVLVILSVGETVFTGWLRALAPFPLLAAAGVLLGVRALARERDHEAPARIQAAYALIAGVGLLLALGPRVYLTGVDAGPGLYRTEIAPLLAIIRAPDRFTLLFSAGVSVLAGCGLARLLRGRGPAVATLATAIALVLVNHEVRLAPLATEIAPEPAPVHRWLADQAEEGAVIEYPWDNSRWSLYTNLFHDRRLVNGRGYVWPPRLNTLARAPDLSPAHFELLWEYLHPRFVVVRLGLYGTEERAQVERSIEAHARALKLRARFGNDAVYELIDRGVGQRLYRHWLADQLRGKRGLVISGTVSGGRSDTIPKLVVQLNDEPVVTALGAEAVTSFSHTVPLEAARIRPGENTVEIRADYEFAAGVVGYPIGATGTVLRADVLIDANPERSRVEINGQVAAVEKGYLLLVVDPQTGEVTGAGSFNTSGLASESQRLAAFVADIPTGSPVVVASEFDVSRALTVEAVTALGELGLDEDLRDRFGWSHAAIGVKGAPRGSALERARRGAIRVQLGEIDRRRVALSGLPLY